MDATRKENGSTGPAQLPKLTHSRILLIKKALRSELYADVTTETDSGLIVHCDVVIGNVEHDQLLTIVATVASDYGVEVESVLADSLTRPQELDGAEEAGVEMLGPMAEFRSKTIRRFELT